MSTKKYVSLSKLSTFLDKLKTTFASVSHTHQLKDISDYTVDTALSDTSTNPVQNKVLNEEFDSIAAAMNALEAAVDGKASSVHTHSLTDIEEDFKTLITSTAYQIGGTEPSSGPILWFDTATA